MSQQIKKKFIGDKEVGAAKILIEAGQALRAVDGSAAEVDLIKINGSGNVEVLGSEVASKSYADSAASSAQSAAETYADNAIAALDSDDIGEGASNLYFTDARAKAAAVADSITNGVTDVAPSQNAVYDALALKLDSSLKGANSGLAELDANGKIPTAQLPAIAITDTFVVASQAAMLALTAEVGDVAIRTDESKSYILAATPASTLANWKEILSPADAVSSVNGQTGAVTLDSDDISEGTTNLYYTSGRFDSDFGGKDSDDLSEGVSNLYYTEGRFDSSFGGKDTDDLSEGSSNLYYTSARFSTDFGLKSTSDLSEGTNLYYTSARFDTDFGGKDTDDLSEGVSNLYYTEARFSSSLSGKDTDDLTEGGNLYFTDARAKSAAVVNSTAGSETDQAPSVSAIKSYVDSAVSGAAADWHKEKITLVAGDISSQYVNLAYLIDEDSIVAFVARLGIHRGDDFTLSTVSGVTRLTFAGPLATGGNSALVAGDVLYITYAKA